MSDIVKEFNDYRTKMNDKILADGNNKIIKRIFNLDTNAYTEGALDVKTKELLGLVASAVLRCDDCIKYHLETSCHQLGQFGRIGDLADISQDARIRVGHGRRRRRRGLCHDVHGKGRDQQGQGSGKDVLHGVNLAMRSAGIDQ